MDNMDKEHEKCDHCCNKKNNDWGIQLRNCGNVICISCVIQLIEDVKIGKIHCLCCPEVLHENDINALLDLQNADLESYMPKERRESILFERNLTGIVRALGGWQRVRQCPNCLNVYSKKIGCNFVHCANCGIHFCFQCGEGDVTWNHFIQGRCTVEFDDMWQGSYPIRFMGSNPLTLFFATPSIFMGLYFFMPLLVTFGFPYKILKFLYIKQMEGKNKTVSEQEAEALLEEAKDEVQQEDLSKKKETPWMFIIECIVLALPLLLLGLILSFFTVVIVANFLFLIYVLTLLIRCIPVVGQTTQLIECAMCITGLFGYGDWMKLFKDAREAKDRQRIEEEHLREVL